MSTNYLTIFLAVVVSAIISLLLYSKIFPKCHGNVAEQFTPPMEKKSTQEHVGYNLIQYYNPNLLYVYNNVGFKPCKSALKKKWLIFPLHHKSFSCEKIFEDWILINAGKRQSLDHQSIREFSLNGTIPFWTSQSAAREMVKDHQKITSERTAKRSKRAALPNGKWDTQLVNEWIGNVARKEWGKFSYGNDAAACDHAVREYPQSGDGLIIGSMSPWLEAIFLHYGAKHLTTIDYNPRNSTDPRIKFMHSMDLARQFHGHSESFDFIATFSSIEHSGLTLYGDRLDPWGDIREMKKSLCLLKPGGFFFLGLPAGSDVVLFGGYRVYGLVRWPMMAAGFKVHGVYHRATEEDPFVPTWYQHPIYQPVIPQREYFVVMQKRSTSKEC